MGILNIIKPYFTRLERPTLDIVDVKSEQGEGYKLGVDEFRTKALISLMVADEENLNMIVMYHKHYAEISKLAEEGKLNKETMLLLLSNLEEVAKKISFYSTKIPEITVEEYASVFGRLGGYQKELKQYYADLYRKKAFWNTVGYEGVTLVLFVVWSIYMLN